MMTKMHLSCRLDVEKVANAHKILSTLGTPCPTKTVLIEAVLEIICLNGEEASLMNLSTSIDYLQQQGLIKFENQEELKLYAKNITLTPVQSSTKPEVGLRRPNYE